MQDRADSGAEARTRWPVHVEPGYRVGDWEVTTPVACGSWGAVYAARRPDPGSGAPAEAALKFLVTHGLPPVQARQLAETAAREVAFSRRAGVHGIIGVLDTFVLDDPERPELDGAVVVAMERAERSLVDALGAPGSPAPREDSVTLAVGICEALAGLHASGWVHGDLKPANILLMHDGSPRLADFGLVTELDGTHGYAPPLGSPDYLPPERRTASLTTRGVAVRPASDIWALGVTLHQVLSGGALPFQGGSPAARSAAAQEYAAGRATLRLSPELPAAWRDIVADCLTADPEARARHTASALAERARRAGAARERRPARMRWGVGMRQGARWAAGTAGLLGACGAVWWGAIETTPASQPVAARPATAPITVYNVEAGCRTQAQRIHACSMGLAVDPLKPYDADNVVSHRMWHGDVFRADCVLYDGTRVGDETGVETTRWFRVLLPDVPGGHAWFPAVRTHDDPKLPTCTR